MVPERLSLRISPVEVLSIVPSKTPGVPKLFRRKPSPESPLVPATPAVLVRPWIVPELVTEAVVVGPISSATPEP